MSSDLTLAGPCPSRVDLPFETWDHLEEVLTRFEAAWQRGDRPRLEDYLAEASGAEATALLIELVQEDLEYRLRAGESARVEEYLAAYPQLRSRREIVLDLTTAEYLGRERRGEGVITEEYRGRFPEIAATLDSAIAARRAHVAGKAPSTAPMLAPETRAPDHAPTVPMPAPEVYVPGFTILGKLGEGGMGVVWHARQESLDREVALKMIRSDRTAEPEVLARFHKEAQVIAQLRHSHIVAIYDFGAVEGVPYFAQELCSGGSLADQIDGRPQPLAASADLVEKLARAVQAAHDRGVVHRDLKPANVLLTPAGDEPPLNTPWGVPKVVDFGLCRMLNADLQRSIEGTIAGTPMYMAPEQAEGRVREIGPATDVWALGIILYELLTGRRPFLAENLADMVHAICRTEPPRPSELRPEVPAELDRTCLRCLKKNAADRYATAADLAADLQRWLAVASGDSHRIIKPRGRAKVPRMVLAAGALLAAGLLGLAGWARFGRPVAPSGPVATATPPVVPGATEPQSQPLKVRMRVVRMVPGDDRHFEVAGELGDKEYRTRLGDKVAMTATFSEPVYAYLLAFNPAEKPEVLEQCFPKAIRTEAPTQNRDLSVPLVLDDGVGLQVLAVVASRRPLPAYTDWLKQRPRLEWKLIPATSGVVWRSDGGEVVGAYDPGLVRAREDTDDDKAAVGNLARRLKALPGIDAVAVIGFAVDRK
jgi:tRNA A-37 threonylcarbamoyl transferase component Bud32